MHTSSKTSESTDYLETIEILKDIPGGREFLDWFGGQPIFGDAEVISLCLDRLGPSWLRIAMCKLPEGDNRLTIAVTMTLQNQIDLSIEGFSHQNVIGDLTIRKLPADQPTHISLLGVGISPPAHEIKLEPCAGSFGVIHATISSIAFEVLNDAFL